VAIVDNIVIMIMSSSTKVGGLCSLADRTATQYDRLLASLILNDKNFIMIMLYSNSLY